MLKKFSLWEIAILFMAVIVIFYTEYLFVVEKDYDRALFIGLWPPTMLLLLIYFNTKKN
jgi:energy-coupling factor transporter transmembrane protein EcfT